MKKTIPSANLQNDEFNGNVQIELALAFHLHRGYICPNDHIHNLKKDTKRVIYGRLKFNMLLEENKIRYSQTQ